MTTLDEFLEHEGSLEERDPARAGLNALERIRRITTRTTALAESEHAIGLLEAVQEQVGEELEIIERVVRRLGHVA
jgi:hypothetical protein